MDPPVNLYVREGDRLVPASGEDEKLACGYPRWPQKGAIDDGRRVTIMTPKQAYDPREEVRVIHVLEVTEPGHGIYVMGPKEVFDEYVDGERRGAPSPDPGDPFAPAEYDGRVPDGPGVDFNYEITTYAFEQPGVHRIQWRPGRWRSNVVEVTVGD